MGPKRFDLITLSKILNETDRQLISTRIPFLNWYVKMFKYCIGITKLYFKISRKELVLNLKLTM